MEEYTPEWRSAKVLALDLDHCLVRYRIHALQRLIYACLARSLCEREGWQPAALAALPPPPSPPLPLPTDSAPGTTLLAGEPGDGLDATPLEQWAVGWAPALAQKGLVFDAATGDLLKLGAQGQVLAAWHGLQQVGAAQVAARHGAEYWGFGHLQRREKHAGFAQLTTYFDAPAAVTLAQGVAALDAASPPLSPPAAAAAAAAAAEAAQQGGAAATPQPPLRYAHLLQQHFRTFDHIFDNAPAFASGRGGFFAALRMHPELYICERRAAAAHLRALAAARACRLVLVTNSHPDYARFVLRASLGAGWEGLFDSIFFSSNKPGWFAAASSAAPPPLLLAPAAPSPAAAPPPPPPPHALPRTWGAGLQVTGGSAADLVAAYGSEGLVFAGDHVVTDVVAARLCPVGAWCAMGVVEELEWSGEEEAAVVARGPWGGWRDSLSAHHLATHASVITGDVTVCLEVLAGGAALLPRGQ